MRRRVPWPLLLFAASAGGARGPEDVAAAVSSHIDGLVTEIKEMFIHFCQPTEAVRATVLSPDNVNVPSCQALADANLETYYGNINLLVAEAWRSKILPSLEFVASQPKTFPRPPRSHLLLVHETSVDNDSIVAGGIFLSQLVAWMHGEAVVTDMALMIGIHRTPKHKMRRHLGQRPDINVTNAIVERAQEWTTTNGLSTLFVCPLSGDGGALRSRLAALGFADQEAAPRVALGQLDVQGDVCEASAIMAWFPPLNYPDSAELRAMQQRDEL